jgi:hypothetical protein
MWADGSLNKIKRVYLDPLEIEPATSPVITQRLSLDQLSVLIMQRLHWIFAIQERDIGLAFSPA